MDVRCPDRLLIMSDDLKNVIEIFKEASADPVRSEAVVKAENYSPSAFPVCILTTFPR